MLKHKKSMFSGNFKVLPIWNSFYFINLAIFGDFVAIFEKKWLQKKIFFQKNIFKFFEIAYFEHNSARFEEKFFLKIWKKFFENFTSWKKCNLGHYFWFLIDFRHTNNLSQALLSWYLKKFLCHMYTLCIPRQTKWSLWG